MANERVIHINTHLRKLRLVVLILFVAGIGAGYFLYRLDTNLFDWVALPVVWVLYVLYFAGNLLSAYVNGKEKVVFSAAEQAVYSQTILGRKTLMSFREIGAIKPYGSGYGATYFALFGRDNLYGRNPIRISPTYSSNAKGDRAYAEFERVVLPQLWAIIDDNSVPEPHPEPALTDANLVYFVKENDVYRLKSVYNHSSSTWAVVVGFLTVAGFILLSPSLRLPLLNYAIGTGLGAVFMGFLLTEKKQFQPGQFVTEYTNGLFRRAYPLPQFSTYSIIHRRYNFSYVGTDINLIFVNQRDVFLCQMRQTQKIETLIREIDYIIDKE